MLYRILFHFLFRKEFSCTRSGSNDLLSYGMNFVENLSFLPGFILREERKNKTNNLKRKKMGEMKFVSLNCLSCSKKIVGRHKIK